MNVMSVLPNAMHVPNENRIYRICCVNDNQILMKMAVYDFYFVLFYHSSFSGPMRCCVVWKME